MSVFDTTGNPVPALKGASNLNDKTTVDVWADPSTHELLVKATIAAGAGGSTQYADGDARGTATGTLGMVDDGTNIQSMAGDTSGNMKVVGNVAAAATDSGNPVKVGGVLNTTLPTYTNGQRGDLQIGTRGSLKMQITSADSTTGATVSSVNGDAQGFINALGVYAQNLVFNGTNYDRQRGASNVYNGTGVGLTASAMMAQIDDTSPTTVTENNFGNVRMSPIRSLHTELHYFSGRATADNQIKASAGFVHTITVSPLTATPTAGLLTVYDSLTETGTVLHSEWIFATDVGHTVTLDVEAGTGIYVGFDATLANVGVTVSYR